MAVKYLVPSLAVFAVLSISASAAAQASGWQLSDIATARSRYTDAAPASYYELRRLAYDQGYREGAKEGERDARRGERFDYRDEREFQRGDRGYHRNFGDRNRYRQLFRDGYAAGYADAYSRLARYGRNDGRPGVYGPRGPYAQQGGYGAYGGYGRYPGGGGFYAPAFDNGARDGYEKGLEDARKNRSFDPVRHSWYRAGDRHYEGRYGSKDQYKNIYRQGFQQGYQRGYQEGRYRW